MVEYSQDISGLLAAWSKGDEEAISDLVSMVYPELRRIARQHLARRAPDHTLQSAALANEAYLKLIRLRGIRCENRAHFFALCAQIIRRILGLAHNADFELIEDPRQRAICEARSLRLARAMMVETSSFPTIGAVTEAARLAPSYADVRTKQIPVRGLGVGDTLQFQIRKVRTRRSLISSGTRTTFSQRESFLMKR